MRYVLSGRMRIRMADSHDGWVVGDEPCVVIDWSGYADFAKS
ncbi:hypothetical protein [Amycolatopsis granulosa]|nr:hypothetical protein [Amycolatopsis granulosa]NIH84086.1 hypothetical protein [Amycolatopsis granulosa]